MSPAVLVRTIAAVAVVVVMGACSPTGSEDPPEEVERALRGGTPLTIDLRQPPTREQLWLDPGLARRGIGNTGNRPRFDVVVHLPGEAVFEIDASDLLVTAPGVEGNIANPGQLTVFRSHDSVEDAFEHLLSYSDLFEMDIGELHERRRSFQEMVAENEAGRYRPRGSHNTEIGTFGDVAAQVTIVARPDGMTSLLFTFDWTPLPHGTSE